MTITAHLDAAVRAVAPIVGVSVGRIDDKATWRIDFAPEATKEERAAAQQVAASFNVAAAKNAEQAEAAVLDTLKAESRTHPLFEKLPAIDGGEIDRLIGATFPDMTAEQQEVLAFLLRFVITQIRG